MTSITKCNDKTGREIVPGSIIVYGSALGRCAALRIGKVIAIGRKSSYGTMVWRITVRGIDDSWSSRKPELCKVGTLMFPDRIVVLDEERLPDNYRALLAQVAVKPA